MSKISNNLYYSKCLSCTFTKVDSDIENLKIEFLNNKTIRIISDKICTMDISNLGTIKFMEILKDKLARNTNLESEYVKNIIYSVYAKNNLIKNLSESVTYAITNGGINRYGSDELFDIKTLLYDYAYNTDNVALNNDKFLNLISQMLHSDKRLAFSNLDVDTLEFDSQKIIKFSNDLNKIKLKHSFIISYILSQEKILNLPNCANLWESLNFKKKISNLKSFEYIKDNKIDFSGIEITEKICDMVNKDIENVKNAFIRYYYPKVTVSDGKFHIAYNVYPESFKKLYDRFSVLDTSNLDNIYFNAKVEILNDVLDAISYLPIKNYLFDDKGVSINTYNTILAYTTNLVKDLIELILYYIYDIYYDESLFTNEYTHTLLDKVQNSELFKLILEKDADKLIKYLYEYVDKDYIIENKNILFNKYITIPKSEDKEVIIKNYINLYVNDLYTSDDMINILSYIYNTNDDISNIYIDDDFYNYFREEDIHQKR